MRAPTETFERARSLRRAMTLPEVLLWRDLRGCRCAGLRFRRQHPIGPYVLDFYCPEMRLAVEVDGAAHDHEGQVRHDARRDAWLAQRGIRVMRVLARDVLADDGRAGVLDTIAATARTSDAGDAFSVDAPSTALRAVPLPRDANRFTHCGMS